MKYKNRSFRQLRQVVNIDQTPWSRTTTIKGKSGLFFADVCYINGNPIPTNYCVPIQYSLNKSKGARLWIAETEDGKTVELWTKPIPIRAHTRTNLANGPIEEKDGKHKIKQYLFVDGKFHSTTLTPAYLSSKE